MTGLRCDAFLALWNSISEPALQQEYETWHTIEHVPERVGTPGFVWARRYRRCEPAGSVSGAGADSATYFTLYGLAGMQALLSPRYQDLLDRPSPWSAQMRLIFTQFRREPCRMAGFYGVSTGARVLPVPLASVDAHTLGKVCAMLAARVDQGQVLEAMIGVPDPRSLHPLSQQATQGQVREGDALVLLSHWRSDLLEAAGTKLLADLGSQFPQVSLRAPLVCYSLQSVVEPSALPHDLQARQPPRPDLQRQFQGGNLP